MKQLPVEIWYTVAEHCDAKPLVNLLLAFPNLRRIVLPALFNTAGIYSGEVHCSSHSGEVFSRYTEIGVQYCTCSGRFPHSHDVRKIPGYEQGITVRDAFPYVRRVEVSIELDTVPYRTHKRIWSEISDVLGYAKSLESIEYCGPSPVYGSDVEYLFERFDLVPKELVVRDPLPQINIPNLRQVVSLSLVHRGFAGPLERRVLKLELRRILSREPDDLRELQVSSPGQVPGPELDIAEVCELLGQLKLRKLELEHTPLLHDTGHNWALPEMLSVFNFMDHPSLMNSPRLTFGSLKSLSVSISDHVYAAGISLPRLECLRLVPYFDGDFTQMRIRKLFEQAPNIESLVLHSFEPQLLSCIFTAAGALRQLRTLEIADDSSGLGPAVDEMEEVESLLGNLCARGQITSLFIGTRRLFGKWNQRFWIGLYFRLFPKLHDLYIRNPGLLKLYQTVQQNQSGGYVGQGLWWRLNLSAAHNEYPDLIPSPF